MNENEKQVVSTEIPAEAIAKGRSFGDVLTAWMEIYDRARDAAIAPGKTGDKIFSDTMMAAAYRIYLLGVEDGMKEAGK